MASVFTACLVSCENLEPQIFDRLSPSNYPATAEDARTLVTGGYGILFQGGYGGFADISWQSRWVMNTATTDEFVCFWGGSVWETYEFFQWNDNSEHVTAKTYGPYIQGITNCVNIIAQLEPIDIDPDLKTRFQAEMKGVMALLAYTLYDFYGPAPVVIDPEITLDPNSAPDFQPDRPTKEWMVNFIKETAREAADILPATYPTADYGRITKGTALMVLLKLAMKEKDWQEAVSLSSEIMQLGYSLQNNYLSIFSVENEGNSEIIFALPSMVADSRHNNWLAHVLPSNYVEPNGIPIQQWGGYKVPWEMYDKFEEGDQRLEAIWGSVHIGNGEMVDLRSINEAWAQMGAIPYKYPADPASTGEAHGNDWVVYRYADVLLLRAEALNNLSALSSEAIDLINQVRGRANADLISASDFSNAQELNDFILDERFRELFMEGHRREDLIRHGKYLSEAEKRGSSFANETRLIFPIPRSAINENPKITQNPGY